MLDVMIITYNEAENLPHSLSALAGWTHRIFVIDSGSTDGTQEIARRHGAEVFHHDWEGYARQKNWGLDNLPFESPWLLILDADEIVTPRLRKQLTAIAQRPPADVPENGFFLNRLTYFMDRPIRHCGYFPSWNLRLLKRGAGRYESREVHEHVVIPDPVGYVREPMLHHDRRPLEHYFAKHNRYSTLEARALWREIVAASDGDTANVPAETRRRRWLKRHVMPHAPFAGLWRFIYMYGVRLGVLDGVAGFRFCFFISIYDSMVAMKLRELRRQARAGSVVSEEADGDRSTGNLAVPEGASSHPLRPTASGSRSEAASADEQPVQLQPESSPWTLREKIMRAIWMVFGRSIFWMSFHNWYRFRNQLLRLFGAKVGKGVTIRPTVSIEVPWNLEIEDGATVGDYAILYSLGRIHLGKRSIISQYSHLCAGTHDYTDHSFPLIRSPITVHDDVWIGADVFVGPDVIIGELAVVGARSSVYKSLEPKKVYVGNPARPIKERILR